MTHKMAGLRCAVVLICLCACGACSLQAPIAENIETAVESVVVLKSPYEINHAEIAAVRYLCDDMDDGAIAKVSMTETLKFTDFEVVEMDGKCALLPFLLADPNMLICNNEEGLSAISLLTANGGQISFAINITALSKDTDLVLGWADQQLDAMEEAGKRQDAFDKGGGLVMLPSERGDDYVFGGVYARYMQEEEEFTTLWLLKTEVLGGFEVNYSVITKRQEQQLSTDDPLFNSALDEVLSLAGLSQCEMEEYL